MGSVEEILAGYEALRPGQEAFYQELHRHPASPAPSPSGTPEATRCPSIMPAATTCTWPA